MENSRFDKLKRRGVIKDYNEVPLIPKLIFEGVELKARDRYGFTALHWAAENGYEAMAKYLIENAANLDALNEDDETPLQIATKRGHKATCNQLKKKKKK